MKIHQLSAQLVFSDRAVMDLSPEAHPPEVNIRKYFAHSINPEVQSQDMSTKLSQHPIDAEKNPA